ncbi:oxidoreductase [Pontibacter sp. E15-1]|nr:oxidoreductase [Pontibacter sp. E15-1]
MRTAIITGANVGLGYETALDLTGQGYAVVLACRNPEKAAAAKERMLKRNPWATVEAMEIDTSSLASVEAFAAAYQRRYTTLDLLINNAGVMMSPYQVTEDGFESQLATNYLGHFALTGRLLPMLLQTPGSRVVSLSSLAHRWSPIQLHDLHFQKGYSKRKAYGQSKLACLMFAYELDRRLKEHEHRTLSVAAHPGLSDTNLAQHMPPMLKWLSPMIGQSAVAGAQPTLYAALSPNINGGEYIGPNGFQEWRGKPIGVPSKDTSHDERMASALWEKSEEMTGVTYGFTQLQQQKSRKRQ